ncbi:DUF3253 domain-containing protein [Botrimarina mediterranea]|uniref:S-adenosylmethionine tRNA ribosyltransferase n=1 Tax=Botrimarina mediterranea TaxID=2528022 RepID=A0A518KDK5_9BACT|nr:DUF3253 domain-containing protein [Botrimarina mediterranea]QDV75876.1 hypothetical protein Spa11_40990 [Botrimarina mediterranea]QDV80473.1 hypothetical protein K2D_41020 [Planctomycetes bacterium K2D]
MDTSASIEEAILSLLSQRVPGKTICPSEPARQVRPDNWRRLMEATRAVAAQLASQGRIEVTQRGQVIDITSARGPVRLRLPRE